MITNTLLLEKIKDLLESDPLDIYSRDTETVNETNFELVDSRYEEDLQEEEDRYIGSANLFIAASLACYEHFDCTSIDNLTDKQLSDFVTVWAELLKYLKEDRFIRDIGLLSKEKIKIVVDNTKLPE
jgi:hypothetical protein